MADSTKRGSPNGAGFDTPPVISTQSSPIHEACLVLSRWLLFFSLLVAVTGILAFALRQPWLGAWIPSTPPMTPNTSLSLIALTTAWMILKAPLSPFRLWAGRALLLFPMFLGAATLYEYLTSVNLGIDALIFGSRAKLPAYPGRPAPETAICLFACSVSTILVTSRGSIRIVTGQALILLALAISILALTAYTSNIETLYSIFVRSRSIGMAFSTALTIFFLSILIFISRPDHGLMTLLSSATQGGTVVRRLVLAAIIAPPAIGMIGRIGVEAGILTENLRLALAPFLASAVWLVLTWFTASRLDRLDQERLEAEQALANNESRLRAILEVLPVGLWWTDEHGKITHGNPMGQRIWAGTRLGEPNAFAQYKGWWIDTGKPIEPEEWALARAIRNGEVSIEERIEIQCFDGSRKVILNSAMPYRDQNGKILGAIAVNHDIHERYRLEKKLQLLADAGRALLNSIDPRKTLAQVAKVCVPSFADGCAIHQIDDSGMLKTATFEYRESSLSQLVERTLERYVPEEFAPGGIYQVLRSGLPIFVPKAEDYHRRHAVLDETVRELFQKIARSYILVPISRRGKTIGVFSFFQGESGRLFEPFDVSIAQEIAVLTSLAAENAHLYSEANRAIRAREEVVAIVSHDLKNPIAAIRLAAQAMKAAFDGGHPSDPEKLQCLAENIIASSKTMQKLVLDLLDLSKMEVGKFVILKFPTDVKELLSRVESEFSPLAQERQIQLSFHGPAQSVLADLDSDRILQTLSNLIGNSLKFTPPQGKINVFVLPRRNELLFEVADTGPGIRKDDLPHLFDRYWQPQESIKKGAGLGLFICKGIVEAHGGRIWAVANEDKGARIQFVVPIRETSPAKLAG